MLQAYLSQVEGQLQREGRGRSSKVEASILSLVKEYIEDNKPTTIKNICNELNKKPQQIHQVVKKSSTLKKVKVNGFTLVVPSEMK